MILNFYSSDFPFVKKPAHQLIYTNFKNFTKTTILIITLLAQD